VLDLSETQLQRDRQAAEHYGYEVTLLHGDMRNLSLLAAQSFDVVWHAHSINFIPDTKPVFDGVARVLCPGGVYHLSCHNPFTHGVDDAKWNGIGYPLSLPYLDSAEINLAEAFLHPEWDFQDGAGVVHRLQGPREFRHALSMLLNGLIARGFTLLHFAEDLDKTENPAPGTWQHYLQVTVPYLNMWWQFSDVRRDSSYRLAR
jgi:SAM-dependent methyltransferase